jgi:hypothetical protein
LTCRDQPGGSSHYRLSIDTRSGFFRLTRWDDGEPTTLKDGNSDAILRGNMVNRIALTCSKSTISASINNQLLASVTDDTYRSGRIEIGVGVYATNDPVTAEARFDNLRVISVQ